MANTKLPARLLDTSAIPALNVTGDLTVDTTTLKVDSTNNRVGIGITAPTAKLHVDAPGTTAVSLTGGAPAGQIFTNEDFEFAFGLHSSAPYPLYIQGRTASSSSTTARDIVLNPLGANVGIGTAAPAYKLALESTATGLTHNLRLNKGSNGGDYAEIAFQLWNGSGTGLNTFGGSGTSRPSVVLRAVNEATNSAAGAFVVGTFTGGSSNSTLTEKFRVASGGNVGIGTASPAYKLHQSGTGLQRFLIDATDNNANGSGIFLRVLNSGSAVSQSTIAIDNVGNLKFFTGTSSEAERVRIDASGFAVFGGTAQGAQNALTISQAGYVQARATGTAGYFDRLGSNGTILQFRKGGADSGSIGAFGVQPYFAGPNAATGGIRLDSTGSDGVVMPTTNTGANRDAATDLGYSSGGTNVRFRNLYLSGAVVAGAATFAGDVSVPNISVADDIGHTGDADTYLSFENNYLGMYAGGNLNLALSAGGASIKLGGSGAANTLDDYEEGTWTPVIAHNDGSGAIPLTVVSAVYTKIGRVVTVRGYLTAINPNGNAGTTSPYYGIRGFPFAPNGYTVWHMAYASGGITSYGGYMSSANMYFNGASGSSPQGQAHISGTQFNAWGSNLVLMFSATYNIG